MCDDDLMTTLWCAANPRGGEAVGVSEESAAHTQLMPAGATDRSAKGGSITKVDSIHALADTPHVARGSAVGPFCPPRYATQRAARRYSHTLGLTAPSWGTTSPPTGG